MNAFAFSLVGVGTAAGVTRNENPRMSAIRGKADFLVPCPDFSV
jgi:hypothetical protein